jgi:hypothetical protein
MGSTGRDTRRPDSRTTLVNKPFHQTETLQKRSVVKLYSITRRTATMHAHPSRHPSYYPGTDIMFEPNASTSISLASASVTRCFSLIPSFNRQSSISWPLPRLRPGMILYLPEHLRFAYRCAPLKRHPV